MKAQLVVLLFLAHSIAWAQATPSGKLKQMEWLLGSWARTNGKPGKASYESWTRTSDTKWSGVSYFIQGKDTTYTEKIKIIIERDRLFYVADVPENKGLVYFEMTKVGSNEFVCENAKHDFPKRIEYRWDGKVLKARVSAETKGIDYVFHKVR